MRAINIQDIKKFLPIFFKLLHDTFFVLLIFFALSLVAEGLLPGIVASHFGMSKFVVLILGNIFLITFTGRFLNIENSSPLANKKMMLTASFFGILLIINSLLKLNLFLNLFITALAVVIAYFAHSIILEEKEN